MPEVAPNSLAGSLRWSGTSVFFQQGCRLVFTAAIARILGPEPFGIVAQATVFVAVTSLLMDQGLPFALVQRREIDDELVGAAQTVIVSVSILLALGTVLIAPTWQTFFATPHLGPVLMALGLGLVVRALTLVPRAMFMRVLDFRRIGLADIVAAVTAGLLGVAAALTGFSYWALVIQTIVNDLLLTIVLSIGSGWYPPNLRLRRVKELAAFGGRSFVASVGNALVRNVDNLLVGRILGVLPLAYYSLSYRVLLLPIQLIGRTTTGVLFPAFARDQDDLPRIGLKLLRVTQSLAIVAIPGMAFVAVSAHETVPLIFGQGWEPAVPVMQVLAVVGAVQTVYSTTSSVFLGLGRADIQLKYTLAYAVASLGGICVGLIWGILGVAIGYAVAVVSLVPVIMLLQRHLLGVSIGAQVRCVLPAVHGASWTFVGYYLCASLMPRESLALRFGVGLMGGLAVGLLALALFHRIVLRESWSAIIKLLAISSRRRRDGD